VTDPFRLLLTRADTRESAFSADEMTALSSVATEQFLSAGLLRAAANATAIVCDACAGDHVEEVGFVESPSGTGLRAYIRCPEAGRVAVPLERLRRWAVDCSCLARLIAAALGIARGAEEVVAARVWRLGNMAWDHRAHELFLCRGLAWPDGEAVITGATRFQASIRPIVLTPVVIPSRAIWSGAVPAVLPITTLAFWEKGRVSVDRALIEDAVTSSEPMIVPAQTPPLLASAESVAKDDKLRRTNAMAPAWITYEEAMLILHLSRTRVADYVKSGDLQHNGLAGKKKRVSAESVALLRLRLETERLQERGRSISEADPNDDDPSMGGIPGRPTVEELVERAKKGKSLK
jgi:hypothetical protein